MRRLLPLAILLSAFGCDATEVDGPTIGGTYAGTTADGATDVRLVVPDGTPSDPDRQFAVSDAAASPPVQYRAVYDDPALQLVPVGSGSIGLTLGCTVVREGDVFNCTYLNGAFLSLTRE